ncbi:hypothetical protein [Cytobacillus sp. IB215665]|uniref:hypothetical protein n=1 Tax=Cytobacillus sp. IB215665 TaxID=3097357 RepID=UPI002A0F3585|nr:hypothetical protein [Cytobacillus sp. IB215665]MDX8365191.1 hypothetical protein [Cytobacillus sp. IB215665]
MYRVLGKQKSDVGGARKFLRERLINKEPVIFIALNGGDPLDFVQLMIWIERRESG